MENNKMKLKLGDNHYLVCTQNQNDKFFPDEFVIYIEDEDGCVVQDICLARPHCEIPPKKSAIKDAVDVIVWGDANTEDYTEKLIIPIYKED